MVIKTSRSKFVAYASLILFFLLIVNNSYLNGITSQESEAELFFKDGVNLFKNGEYNKALENFSKVLTLTKDKRLQTDTYFYLSLVNFYIGEKQSSIEWIKRVIENEPDRELSSLHPPEFISLFQTTKEEYTPKPKPEPVEEKKAVEKKPEPRTVAVKNGKKKGGGGTVLLVVAGLAVAGGVAALLLLKGKPEPTEGSIQVNSTPQGAEVHLDGSNTGRTTNTTITNVSVGTHTVKILKDGYGDREETVTVTGDQPAVVDVTLNSHTISITQPASGTSWVQGQEVQIRWTTGGGLVQVGSFRTNQAMNQAIHTARLNRQRMNPSNSAIRRSNADRRISNQERYARGQSMSRRFAKIQEGSKSEGIKGGSRDLRNPGNSNLDRMKQSIASPRKLKPLGDVSVQTLSNIKIELYQGNSLREEIVPSAPNTGNYDWTVTPSLPDGTNYRVRISCSTDENVYGESASFAISPSVGKISVKSTPSGAAIWLNGSNTGQTTPATLNDVPVGTPIIRLVLERYQDWEYPITVIRNETTPVTATLQVGNFTENFSDGIADYWNRPSGTWAVIGGIYKLTGGSPYGQTRHSYYDLGTFPNITYSVSCKRVSPSTSTYESSYGITLRGGKSYNQYLEFMIDPTRASPSFAVKRVYDNGNHTDWVRNWISSSAIYADDAWNTLKVEADGLNFEFYCNDNLIWSGSIPEARTRGIIGLSGTVHTGNNECHFDNISVEVIISEALGLNKVRTVIPTSPPLENPVGRNKKNNPKLNEGKKRLSNFR